MTKLKCDWCGKNSDEVDELIVGEDVRICNHCVVLCVRQVAKDVTIEFASEVAAEIVATKCSFCGQESITPNLILLPRPRVHICKSCLNLCLDIIKSRLSRLVIDGEGPVDSSGARIELSPKAKEWSRLVDDALDQKDLVREGRIWLKKNKSDEAAGAAFVMLLSIKPTASLVADGESWLLLHRDHESAPELVAELLKADPSPKIVRLAGRYLRSSDDVSYLRPIIRAIIESPPHKGLYDKIGYLLERNPTADTWSLVLLVTPKRNCKSVQNLVLKWLRLNVRNPEAYAYSHILVSKSPEVIEAVFDWARIGGRTSDDISSTLDGLVSAAAKYHRSILPSVLRVARAWLKKNPDHAAAGRVYASVLSATGSQLDIGRARQWHREHRTSEDAWYVISDILNHGYWQGTKPDDFAVKEAQLLLRAETPTSRKPRLVGALLGAHTDAESIAWAKEAYARLMAPWILVRLLLRAPDAETIAEAEASFKRLKDNEELEPEMIYSVLTADPKNKVALKRARVWLKRSPENKWIKAITPLISLAGKSK
ncbi:MAG: ClpX C4-type zinc finger protein [Candidatus Obscuribacterales bacterium]